MAGVSLRRAFASGFLLIKRRPAAVFAWGVLIVLFVEVPLILLLDRFASGVLPVLNRLGSMSPQDANAFSFDLQQRMAVIQTIMLPAVLVRAVIAAAVYRAVLEPKRSAFASLRIGRQEAWLFFLTFAFMAFGYLVVIPFDLVLLIGIFGAILLKTPFSLIGPVVILLALLAGVWAVARLSLAGPMTFSDRNFRMFESWAATRRQGVKLVALGLMLFLFLLAVQLVLGGLVFAAVMAIGG
ncbi:MAG TPA: hypothetical protein VIJ94_14195, partial [Caulobacteraceae bacterium]